MYSPTRSERRSPSSASQGVSRAALPQSPETLKERTLPWPPQVPTDGLFGLLDPFLHPQSWPRSILLWWHTAFLHPRFSNLPLLLSCKDTRITFRDHLDNLGLPAHLKTLNFIKPAKSFLPDKLMYQFRKLGFGIFEGHHSSYCMTPKLCPKSCLGRAWAPLQSWDTKMRGQGALNLALLSNVGREEPSHTRAQGENVGSKTRPQGWLLPSRGLWSDSSTLSFLIWNMGLTPISGLFWEWNELTCAWMCQHALCSAFRQTRKSSLGKEMQWDGMVCNTQVTLQIWLHQLRAVSQRRGSINYQQNTCSC